MTRRGKTGLLAVSALTGAGAFAGQAAAQQGQVEALESEVRELREQVKSLLERSGSAQPAEPAPSPDDEVSARLELLEEQVFNLEDRVGSGGVVNVFDSANLTIGGFITQQFSVVNGDDGTQESFNATQFELLLSADITEDLSLFTALGFLRESDIDITNPAEPEFDDTATRNPLIIGWAKYSVSDKLEIQAGRSITPHGIINIEHFPPVLLDVNQPQFLRPFSGSTLFPNFFDGALASGKFFLGENDTKVLSYSAFAGVQGENTNDILAGGRLQLADNESGLTLGANVSFGRRDGSGGVNSFGIAGDAASFSTTANQSLVSNNYALVGADLLYDKGRILWKTEFFYSFEMDDEEDRWAFYTQPGFRLDEAGKWTVFYRFDYLEPGQGIASSYENMVGLNWTPFSQLRVRANYVRKEINGAADEGLNLFQLSATFSF